MASDELAALKEQLSAVSSNREYKHLLREIEFQRPEIQLAQKHIRESDAELQGRKDDVAKLRKHIRKYGEDHQAKNEESEQAIAETRTEEEQFCDRANELGAQTDGRIPEIFFRLRKGATNSLIVVPVEHEVRDGCSNHIPPQCQLEVELHSKVIVCGYCGRVLVNPDVGEGPVELIDKQADSKKKEVKRATVTEKKAVSKSTKKAVSSKDNKEQ